MTRLLATGDLHLGKGQDYGRTPADRLADQAAAWLRCVDLAVENNADAILWAGDAFETPRPAPEAMLAFERGLIAARDAGIPVVAILGNHDVASAAAGTGLHVFAEAGLLELATEPRIIPVAGVAVACLPWTPTSRLVAARNGGDRDDLHREAADMLVSVARGLRQECHGPAVLLTHFSISGAVTPDGADVGLFREPVLDRDDLGDLGYDLIVAGHIHRPDVVMEMEAGPMLYVGSPLPLTFGEAKCDHGCWIVDQRDRWQQRFVPVESRPFVELAWDFIQEPGLLPFVEQSDFLGCDPPVADAVVKIRLRCTEDQARGLDVPAMRRSLYEAGAHKVWQIALDVERTDRARVEGVDESTDDLDALDRYLDAAGVNGSRAAALRNLTTRYLEEVPS